MKMSQTIMLAAVILLGTGYLRAQGATAAISGTVMDPTGAAIPGASITIKNVQTALTRNIISDDQGRYVAPELPIGEYEVQGSRRRIRSSGKRPPSNFARSFSIS